MISQDVKRKVNYMDYYSLDKLANWLINRYWQKEEPELVHYIMVRHYLLEEGSTGLL